MDKIYYQCLECRAEKSKPYAATQDHTIAFCVCLKCGALMIVGEGNLDRPLYPDEDCLFFQDYNTPLYKANVALRAERDALLRALLEVETL